MPALFKHPNTGEVRTPAEMDDAVFGQDEAREQLEREGYVFDHWEI